MPIKGPIISNTIAPLYARGYVWRQRNSAFQRNNKKCFIWTETVLTCLRSSELRSCRCVSFWACCLWLSYTTRNCPAHCFSRYTITPRLRLWLPPKLDMENSEQGNTWPAFSKHVLKYPDIRSEKGSMLLWTVFSSQHTNLMRREVTEVTDV